jgi:hypothetical protein
VCIGSCLHSTGASVTKSKVWHMCGDTRRHRKAECLSAVRFAAGLGNRMVSVTHCNGSVNLHSAPQLPACNCSLQSLWCMFGIEVCADWNDEWNCVAHAQPSAPFERTAGWTASSVGRYAPVAWRLRSFTLYYSSLLPLCFCCLCVQWRCIHPPPIRTARPTQRRAIAPPAPLPRRYSRC